MADTKVDYEAILSSLSPEAMAASIMVATALKAREKDERARAATEMAERFNALRPTLDTLMAEVTDTCPVETFHKRTNGELTDVVLGHGYALNGDVTVRVGDTFHSARMTVSVRWTDRGVHVSTIAATARLAPTIVE